MSRIGRQSIVIPPQIKVNFAPPTLRVSGPQGELARDFKSQINIMVTDNEITLKPARDNDASLFPLWGTYAAHVKNMIKGVSSGFEKQLLIEGIGYKANVDKMKITLSLGFSHPVVVPIPEGLTVTADKNFLTIRGPDKEKVGQFSAFLRSLKKPEPYKGKGIRYAKEFVRQKQGKKVVA